MEFDARGLVGSGIGLIFVIIMWVNPLWQQSTFFTWKMRSAMSIIIVLVGYFMTIKMLDN